ncbi:ATP-binding protein [Nonomuraea sp. M3C6]|uniref:ATP-binding protein n=1 Tax=Nonomuraea marmarensis TaxID=3351344 RepID=A0ABW7AC44_9ACTN
MDLLISQPFTFHDITKLRRGVAELAASRGLHGHRLDDFVLAVHESIVNVVEHAGGHGHFRLWTDNGAISAETTDRGSGIPDGYVNRHRRPSILGNAGRGIYLIRRLCDTADFRTGPGGTTVRLTMRLPREPVPGGHKAMRRIRVTACVRHSFGRFTA